MKLAFRILDGDHDGLIGSVDVVKLRTSMDTPDYNKVYRTFGEMAVKRNLAKTIAAGMTGGMLKMRIF